MDRNIFGKTFARYLADVLHNFHSPINRVSGWTFPIKNSLFSATEMSSRDEYERSRWLTYETVVESSEFARRLACLFEQRYCTNVVRRERWRSIRWGGYVFDNARRLEDVKVPWFHNKYRLWLPALVQESDKVRKIVHKIQYSILFPISMSFRSPDFPAKMFLQNYLPRFFVRWCCRSGGPAKFTADKI